MSWDVLAGLLETQKRRAMSGDPTVTLAPVSDTIRTSMPICRLCLQDRPLVEGHVLSEFLYDDLYDPERHKFLELHTDERKRNVRRSKGLYECLMCDGCDNRIISRYETYASQVLNGGVEIVTRDEPDRLVVTQLDYTKFKLFQVSLLWRSVVSTRDEFQTAIVQTRHAERMRQMLLHEDPGEPHEYGCLVMIPQIQNDLRRRLIMPPDPIKVGGHQCFRLLAGGLWWLYMVSSHTHAFELRDYFLAKNGTLHLLRETASTAFIHEFAAYLVKNPTFPKVT